jgi:hypothetical protein
MSHFVGSACALGTEPQRVSDRDVAIQMPRFGPDPFAHASESSAYARLTQRGTWPIRVSWVVYFWNADFTCDQQRRTSRSGASSLPLAYRAQKMWVGRATNPLQRLVDRGGLAPLIS